jgi:hypothetical protein
MKRRTFFAAVMGAMVNWPTPSDQHTFGEFYFAPHAPRSVLPASKVAESFDIPLDRLLNNRRIDQEPVGK